MDEMIKRLKKIEIESHIALEEKSSRIYFYHNQRWVQSIECEKGLLDNSINECLKALTQCCVESEIEHKLTRKFEH